jgi:subtilisin family serine protease
VGVDPRGYKPPHLHGTYIASIIAGHGSGPGRSEGIIGVAPDATILSVRVIVDKQEPGSFIFDQNASYYDSLARGIFYAVRHGVGVINMSLGAVSPTRDLRQAVGFAISRGVVVVAAAGNSGAGHAGFTPYDYPAAFTGVISVAAVNASGTRAFFSDHNSSVLVSAPGVNVPGAAPGGQYLIGSGTSPASAFVAGVAALIRAKYPRLSPALVAQAIVSSTQRRPPGGYNTDVGFGEIDASAALAAAARLAGMLPATGFPAGAHFGGEAPGPIAVAHRDYPLALALLAVAIVAGAGFGLATVALARHSVRRRRRHRHVGAQALAPEGTEPAAPWPAGELPAPLSGTPGTVAPIAPATRDRDAITDLEDF